MSELQTGNIESVLQEERRFPPPAQFVPRVSFKTEAEYQAAWDHAERDPAGYWGRLANENLTWDVPFQTAMSGDMPETKWFLGGKLNASSQCLDRHLETLGNKAAIIWEGEPGDSRVLRYQDLHREVCRFANVLKRMGIQTGDRVTLYMPMVPELAIAMLACARIGATHSIIFGGFSSDAVAERNNDAQAKLVVTADAGWRRGKEVPLKAAVDESLVGGDEIGPDAAHVAGVEDLVPGHCVKLAFAPRPIVGGAVLAGGGANHRGACYRRDQGDYRRMS